MNKSENPVYFPGLNGLRAIAALAVVLSHITQSLKFFNLSPYIFGTLSNGGPKGLSLAANGVSIFFCLSGFLITYLLLSEKKVNSINVKKFYIRRLLRIWPLYYLYLLIVIIVAAIYGFGIDIKSLLLYLFFFCKYSKFVWNWLNDGWSLLVFGSGRAILFILALGS